LRGLWSRKLRTALTFVVVMLGVSLMAGTLVLTDTIKQTFDDLFADVNRGTDVYVRGVTQFESSFGDTLRPRLDDGLVGDIEAVDGVAIAEPLVQGYAQIIDMDGEPIGDPGFGPPTFGGKWATVDELNPFTLVEGGRPPEADDELVIDKRSADEAGFGVGDRVGVQTQAGLEGYELVGVARFGTADSPGGATFALMTLPAAQQRVAQPGTIGCRPASATTSRCSRVWRSPRRTRTTSSRGCRRSCGHGRDPLRPTTLDRGPSDHARLHTPSDSPLGQRRLPRRCWRVLGERTPLIGQPVMRAGVGWFASTGPRTRRA
jgi:MacB-like periplasmic core domain